MTMTEPTDLPSDEPVVRPGQQELVFERRWLSRHAGRLITDPQTALVELVANAWDAYATHVVISTPRDLGEHFEIFDNGVGMTPDEFRENWRTIDYDRITRRGPFVQPPPELIGSRPRRVFGRNGRGRHASFFFGDRYSVTTWRDGVAAQFEVSRGISTPFDIKLVEERASGVEGHGTRIRVENAKQIAATDRKICEWIGTRFLFEPTFDVRVNGVRVTFQTLPGNAARERTIDVREKPVTIRALDSGRADPTARAHGITWWVERKRVGESSWRGEDYEKILDGRSSEAKRYSFIVLADLLVEEVEADWTGFRADSELWKEVYPKVQGVIAEMLDELTAVRRETKKTAIRERSRSATNKLSPLRRSLWSDFIDTVVDKCPGLGEDELVQLGVILANLETSESQYGLLDRLQRWSPGEFDELHHILEDWTVQTAKIALDEVATRLKLIQELIRKVEDPAVHEVQELQPLFARGLWMFGAEFESIEYTSNRAMTTVIADLFNAKVKGSRDRPDFVVLPDATVGFYGRPSFDAHHDEIGTDAVVIVEIKRPGIPVGEEHKSQVWRYAKELIGKGAIQEATRVHGFLLGSEIALGEGATRVEGNVSIVPLRYSTVLSRAERRMFNLREKLGSAPFLSVERGQEALL